MLVIDNGDAIRGIAEVATQLDFIVNGYVGTTATQLADGQMGTSEADLYLSGANGIVVTSITIVNTDSVARTFTLYLKPSGGTSRAISPVSLDLGIGYSFHSDGQRVVVMDATGNTVSTATVLSHALGGSSHDADTLANLSTKVSDDTVCGLTATQELDNKTLDSSVAKGTWTASGTWTIPAVTLGGTVTLNGQVFDAGSGSARINTAGASNGLLMQVTADGSVGALLETKHITASPAVDDYPLILKVGGKDHLGNDHVYHQIQYRIADKTHTTEAGYIEWRISDGGALNTAMTLSGAGALWIDAGLTVGGDIVMASNAITGHAQAIGDNAVLTIDGSPNSGEFARFTANGLEGRTVAETVTTLLGTALPENTTIILDALLSGDEKWSGISEIGTMGYGATVGDLVYLAVADTKYELADADAAATSKGKIGLVTVTTNENSTCQVLLYGKMRSAAFPAFTVGAPVHVGTTAGDVQVAAPTGTGKIVRVIGYGNTAEDFFFCPDNTYIELA